ncbi:amino acid adenylation domain-containing protein [Rhizobium paknamense]|uniref:Enterobactin synthetase component F n=1 Tax=Rhizobium paknamense TaxID=1206817 RepID=A0ABU0IJZ8_9HYPH|nr:amino acid adenylation domain-containing protein [Rhizobium paknamense]MDQ0457760.1 enterobactin synthetase component F [Rhizobium paknamense]
MMEKILPVTPAQAGMWISEKVGASGVVFNLAEFMEIHGPVNPQNFCQALRQLTEEIEATRIRIREIEGEPHQVVLNAYPEEFRVLDFSAAADPMKDAYDWMMADIKAPLDLADGLLWTSALVKLSDTRWLWYHRVHHIAFDGFTGGMATRRMAELYNALEEGREPVPCDFGTLEDLLELEASYRTSPHFERDRSYWMEQLQQLPPPVTLAKKRTAPIGGMIRHSSYLAPAKSQEIGEVSKALGVSVPQALIALIAAYYARATDVEDLCIVTMVTARINAAARRLPCMMANAVPLRFKLSRETSLQDLVKQVSQQMMRALRYQRYRYEDMRRDIGLIRQDEQIAFIGVNIEPFDYDLRFGGNETTMHNLSNGTMNDITIFAYDRGDGSEIRMDFDANPGLYSEDELKAHEARFTRMMNELLLDPAKPLADFSLLSDAEKTQILVDWNDTARPLPDLTWPDLFRNQAKASPERVAVRFADRHLTYAELDAASDGLAAKLQESGIGPGRLVAVAVPRSEQMVIALLGVLKTGAAYLPLDPADPPARIGIILEDAKPGAVITTSEAAGTLKLDGINTLLLDKLADGLAGSAAAFTPRKIRGDDTAYVIFTSGSTGRPKGVQIPHQALVNFLLSMQDLLKLDTEDRILAVTTIAFDIATLELYLPLLVGAQTVIATRDTVRDPAALAKLLKQSGATIMQATPSLWRALLEDHAKDVKGLRSLVGGEALPADLAHRMAALGHPVLNVYGPTETTVWSTAMPLTGADLDTTPIGKPIWNTRLYVLDRSGQPVPPGVAGELYIGGTGVAKGYLDRPDLTAEKFMPDPFVGKGARMYRTGDMACWRNDGVLEYLGRNDHQIKIRGFRVEPGEIEAALIAQPNIRQAVVILREDPGQGKRLVAYLVLSEAGEIDGPDLSARLAASLPSHMIPAAYVVMDAIPLNVNGKIDRHALPAPQWKAEEGFVPPRNETEKMIAAIWCDILGLQEVGVHDSFFNLGGDSLAAARMIAAIRSKMKGELAIAAVFEAPTIATLASMVATPASRTNFLDTVLPIRDKGNSAPLFCIHPVLGMGWGFYSLLGHVSEDTPIYALQSEGLRDLSSLPQSVEEMAERYVERIRSIQPHGPYHLLGWSFGGLVAHEMARQLKEQGEAVSFLGLLDSYPYHQNADAASLDDATLAQAALGFLGFDVDPAELDLNKPLFSVLNDYLFRQYKLDDHPLVEEVRTYEPLILEKARAVVIHHLGLAQKFKPGFVDADMHFFSANRGSDNKAIGHVINHQAEAWVEHVGGKLVGHGLDCSHQDMLDPGPASEIGAVIQAEILREILVLRSRATQENDAMTA